jgi:hypothetical protein
MHVLYSYSTSELLHRIVASAITDTWSTSPPHPMHQSSHFAVTTSSMWCRRIPLRRFPRTSSTRTRMLIGLKPRYVIQPRGEIIYSFVVQSARPSSSASLGEGGHPATSNDDGDDEGAWYEDDDDDYKPARATGSAPTSDDPLKTRSRAASSDPNAPSGSKKRTVDVDAMMTMCECAFSFAAYRTDLSCCSRGDAFFVG